VLDLAGRQQVAQGVAGQLGRVAAHLVGAHRRGGVDGRLAALTLQANARGVLKQGGGVQAHAIQPQGLHLVERQDHVHVAQDAQRLVEQVRVLAAEEARPHQQRSCGGNQFVSVGHGVSPACAADSAGQVRA